MRARVGAIGRADLVRALLGARFDPPGWIREDLAACVLRLVDTAKLTPPEDGESRRERWTTVTVEPKSRAGDLEPASSLTRPLTDGVP